jgi:Flp pilus assembly protein TadD
MSDALNDINRAIALDDHSASAFSTRGLIRERSGDTTGAADDFRQALKLDPTFQQPADALQRLKAGPPKSQ